MAISPWNAIELQDRCRTFIGAQRDADETTEGTEKGGSNSSVYLRGLHAEETFRQHVQFAETKHP